MHFFDRFVDLCGYPPGAFLFSIFIFGGDLTRNKKKPVLTPEANIMLYINCTSVAPLVQLVSSVGRGLPCEEKEGCGKAGASQRSHFWAGTAGLLPGLRVLG